MQPTSALRAMNILAGHTGKSVANDRPWLLSKVNEIRRAKWKFEAARLLTFKVSGCECVQCLTDPCARCANTFTGVTLPVNVTAIHYLEVNGVKVDMTNLRLGNNGCCSSACGCLKAETLVRRAPLYRDMPRGYKGVAVFFAIAAEDKEKRVGVKYITHGNAVIREDLILSLTGVETSQSPARFEEITFPDRCGWVRVQTQEGFELGSYHPSITAPSHYRLRLTGASAGDLVQWEGLREPHDVIFDTDLVEWGDPLDWKNDLQWLNLHFQTSKTPSEQNAYVASATLAKAGVESELAATMPIPSATLRPNAVSSLRRRIRSTQRF